MTKAQLIGCSSGGLTAVEIYEGDKLIWSGDWFANGASREGYIAGLIQVVDTMRACERCLEWELVRGEDGQPLVYDKSISTDVIAEYDSATGLWKIEYPWLGQSTEIAYALQAAGLASHNEVDPDDLDEDRKQIVDAIRDHLVRIYKPTGALK